MDGRDIRHLPTAELPELEIIGNTEIQKPLPALDIAFAAGCMNIYFGYKGSKQMQAEGGSYQLSGGEYFTTPPGVTHSTGPMPISKCAHYWLRLNLSLDSDFLGNAAYNPIRQRLLELPISHGRFSDVGFDALRSIYDLATQKESMNRNLELRLQVSLFTLKLLEQIDAEQNLQEHSCNPTLDKVLDYLNWHLGETLSVQDMANIASISSSALQQLFIKHQGMSPAEYFTRKKMDFAKDMLIHNQCSVRSISEQLGYANERYFSTVFKKYHIDPPGRFRQKFAE